jgi:hypothetical protein
MSTRIPPLAFHTALSAFISALLALAIAHPFLPGSHDPLVIPLSSTLQAASGVSLLFIPLGIFALKAQARRRVLLGGLALVGSLVTAVACLVALMTAGIAMALVMLVPFAAAAFWLREQWRTSKSAPAASVRSLAIHLILTPTLVVVAQVLLAGPLTEASRARATANAGALIADIERYHAREGRYPAHLIAQWKDYHPGIAGIERYHYAPHDEAYNLSFEQPRFLFDRPGTREWVVYNPADAPRAYSHVAWFMLLSPEELERSQGWYAKHDTGRAHWTSFWFD